MYQVYRKSPLIQDYKYAQSAILCSTLYVAGIFRTSRTCLCRVAAPYFRGDSSTKTAQTHWTLLRCKPKLRSRTVTRLKKGRKVHQIPYMPQNLRIYRIWSQECASSPQSLVGLCIVSPKPGPTQPNRTDIRTWQKIMTHKTRTCTRITTRPYGENEIQRWNSYFFSLSKWRNSLLKLFSPIQANWKWPLIIMATTIGIFCDLPPQNEVDPALWKVCWSSIPPSNGIFLRKIGSRFFQNLRVFFLPKNTFYIPLGRGLW